MNRHRLLVSLLAGVLAVTLAAPAYAQNFLGKNAAQWSAGLKSPNATTRRSAAFALGKLQLSSLSYLQPIVGMLKSDTDARVREAAAFALGDICVASVQARNDANVLEALKDKLSNDADPMVRRSCAYAFGCMGKKGEGGLTALNNALKHTDPAVRQNVAWALGKIGASGVYSLRNALSGETDAFVLRDAAFALRDIGPDARPAVGALVKHTANRNPEVRKAVVSTLVALVGEDNKDVAAAPLRAALKDPVADVKQNAALALSNIGGAVSEPAVPILAGMLQTGRVELKRKAAAHLGNVGLKAILAVPVLVKALRDPDMEVRKNSATALGGIKTNAVGAVPALVAVVVNKNEEEPVRSEAAVSLRHIGDCAAAVDAIPTLVRTLENKTNPLKVRAYILWALRVHKDGLLDYDEVMNALETIVAKEKKVRVNKMLRYDSAYMLGMLKQDEVSAAAMQTLQEFILDDDVLVYAGTTIAGGGGETKEKTGKGAKVTKKGTGDGRVMAIQALSVVGADKIQEYPRILAKMRALAKGAKTDPALKKLTMKVLTKLEL